MFNLPTNIRLPGFRVGLPDDPPGQNTETAPALPCQPLVTIRTAIRFKERRPPARAPPVSTLKASFR